MQDKKQSQVFTTVKKSFKVLSQELVQLKKMKFMFRVIMGDITKQITDCIVNAANSDLMHIGGLAYAIVKVGGWSIIDQSNAYTKKNRLPIGEAISTTSGNLQCKKLIHTVGPVGRKDIANDCQLRHCVISSLEQCDRLKLKSIAIPAISTGVFGFPKHQCGVLMINACLDYMVQYQDKTHIRTIHLTNNDEQTAIIFQQLFQDNVMKRIQNKGKLGTGGIDKNEKQIYKKFDKYSYAIKKQKYDYYGGYGGGGYGYGGGRYGYGGGGYGYGGGGYGYGGGGYGYGGGRYGYDGRRKDWK